MVWVMVQKRIDKINHQWRHLGLDTGLCVQCWPGSLTHLHLTQILSPWCSALMAHFETAFFGSQSLEPRGDDGIVKKKLYWERIKVWDVCIIDVEGPGLNREKAAGSGRAGLSRSDQTLEPEQFITSRHNIVQPDYRWIANELFVSTLPFDSLTFELSDGDHPLVSLSRYLVWDWWAGDWAHLTLVSPLSPHTAPPSQEDSQGLEALL